MLDLYSLVLRSLLAIFVTSGGLVFGGESVLLDFTTPGCGPCRQMAPVLAQLARRGYRVRTIDASREPELARTFGVDRFPTFVAVVDGREFARIVGITTSQQLERMLLDATKTTSGASLPEQPPQTAATFVSEPRPGRVVAIQDDAPARQRPPRPMRMPAQLDGHRALAEGSLSDAARLIAATVRLRIQDPHGASIGTGTIVDARQGHALVLTCGHIFRESAGKGTVLATVYRAGPRGAEEVETIEGRVIEFDLERDLGLIEIRPSTDATAVRLAPSNESLVVGHPTMSVGCDHGTPPSVLTSRITALNRFSGTPNVEASGAPAEGRSGGGLFNQRGELIGVCLGAEPQADEGMYMSIDAICAKLSERGLDFVYKEPSAEGAAPMAMTEVASLASADPPQTSRPAPLSATRSPMPLLSRGQNSAAAHSEPGLFGGPLADDAVLPTRSPAATSLLGPTSANASAAPNSPTQALSTSTPAPQGSASARQPLSDEESATLEEIERLGIKSEVICIIRPLTPDGSSEVIKIGNASPAFVGELQKRLAR